MTQYGHYLVAGTRKIYVPSVVVHILHLESKAPPYIKGGFESLLYTLPKRIYSLVLANKTFALLAVDSNNFLEGGNHFFLIFLQEFFVFHL